MKPVCILHLCDLKNQGEIRLFINNMSSWDKVVAVKERRLKFIHSSKYAEILLTMPDVFNSNHGYHTPCYKNFTAFSGSTYCATLSSLTPGLEREKKGGAWLF